jgi:hypothetical protein
MILREDNWSNDFDARTTFRVFVVDALDVLRDHAAGIADLQKKVGGSETFAAAIAAPPADMTPLDATAALGHLVRLRAELDNRIAKLRPLAAA